MEGKKVTLEASEIIDVFNMLPMWDDGLNVPPQHSTPAEKYFATLTAFLCGFLVRMESVHHPIPIIVISGLPTCPLRTDKLQRRSWLRDFPMHVWNPGAPDQWIQDLFQITLAKLKSNAFVIDACTRGVALLAHAAYVCSLRCPRDSPPDIVVDMDDLVLAYKERSRLYGDPPSMVDLEICNVRFGGSSRDFPRPRVPTFEELVKPSFSEF